MSKIDLEEFAKNADKILKKAIEENRLIDNPSDEELRLLVETSSKSERLCIEIWLQKVNLLPGQQYSVKTVLTILLAKKNPNC